MQLCALLILQVFVKQLDTWLQMFEVQEHSKNDFK